MQAALLLGSIYIRKIAYAASVVADAPLQVVRNMAAAGLHEQRPV
jgi:hypothetical protein